MEIFDKLKDLGLSEENLVELKTSIKDQVSEAVEAKVADEVDKITIAEAEKYERKLSDEITSIKSALAEEYDAKMVALEEKLVDSMDQFLDLEISENISDKMLERIAINETLVPLFGDLRSLFEEKYIEMDTEGEGILRAAKVEIETLEDKMSESISEKMDLKKELDTTKAKLIIVSKTAGLTQNESDRVETFLNGKSLAEVEKSIDNLIEVVTENSSSSDDSENLLENIDATTNYDYADDDEEEEEEEIEDVNESAVLSAVEKMMV
jgi:hypothetical protein